MKNSQIQHAKRAVRTHFRLKGLARRNDRLRLSVFRSNGHIYAQIIDDAKGETLASASTMDKKLRKDIEKATVIAAAEKVGTEIAARAKKAGVKEVYFDRGGFRFHGRVKALADAARAGGLEF